MNFFNKKQYFSNKGFTLIEVVVALAVFSIAIIAITHVFVTIVKSYRIAKEMQLNIEQTEYALGLIGKTLRTSEIDPPPTSPTVGHILRIFDPSQGKCLIYKIDTSSHRLKWASDDSGSPTQISDCNFGSMTTVNFINSPVTGSFYITSNNPNTVGKITINLNVQQGEKSARLQTTVSLRNHD